MIWLKYYHNTNIPYKKNNKSGAWYIVDYISDNYKIVMQPNGDWLLTNNDVVINKFKTLKSAKLFAESEIV